MKITICVYAYPIVLVEMVNKQQEIWRSRNVQ